MLSRIHKRFGSRLRRLVVQLTGKRALVFANLLLFPAMPSSKNNRARAKKTRTRAKKDKTKLQNASESDGRVINKNGNRVIFVKSSDNNRKTDPAAVLSNVRLMPGTVLSMSDHHLINVKISKWEEINVMINKNDSYADITSKIQFRARALRMPMPSNWELKARVEYCEEFARGICYRPPCWLNELCNQHSTFVEAAPPALGEEAIHRGMKKPSAAHNCELPIIEG